METESKVHMLGREGSRPASAEHGVASLPLGAPVELEVIFEVEG